MLRNEIYQRNGNNNKIYRNFKKLEQNNDSLIERENKKNKCYNNYLMIRIKQYIKKLLSANIKC